MTLYRMHWTSTYGSSTVPWATAYGMVEYMPAAPQANPERHDNGVDPERMAAHCDPWYMRPDTIVGESIALPA